MSGHQYTSEEINFMKEFVPGHSYKEIQNVFINKFGWNITLLQIKGYIRNHKLNTGRDGRFQKGSIPANKGKKGYCAPGCKKTWFKKGNVPVNYRPVGSERVSKDGYVEIKVADPNVWRLKQRVLWEEVHGKIPKGYIVIFKDGNKENVDIENLIMISRRTHAVMNYTDLHYFKNEYKETAVKIAEVKVAISKKVKKV